MSNTATQTLTKAKIKDPSMWTVILHNDDYTPMDFVIAVLVQIFHKSNSDAEKIMWQVHEKGSARVGLYTKEVAMAKVSQVKRAATSHNHPLQCTAEEA